MTYGYHGARPTSLQSDFSSMVDTARCGEVLGRADCSWIPVKSLSQFPPTSSSLSLSSVMIFISWSKLSTHILELPLEQLFDWSHLFECHQRLQVLVHQTDNSSTYHSEYIAVSPSTV